MRNPPEYQNPLQGMALMAGAMLVLPTMDAIAKYMATVEAMSPGQVTFYRFFFQLVCTLPFLFAVFGRKALHAKRPWMNLLRGALPWGGEPALLRCREIYAARGRIRDLFCRAPHAHGAVGYLPR